MLIDIGANLAHESFDADRDAVLRRARAAGVEAIVVTGSSLDSSRQAIAQVQADASAARIDHPQLYATTGLHPHHAAQWSQDVAAQFRELADRPEIVAVGECGLDYFRDLSPREAQRAAFVAQLEIAADTGKPLFLHQRDAHADFIAILREHRPQLSDCVVHCFTDTGAALDDCLALDCHIGITGWICDERRGSHLPELVRRIPAERLLIETDAPYLLPRTIKPAPKHRRNEPAFLTAVLAKIAEARGDDYPALAAQTTLNTRRFFRLPDAPAKS